MIDMRAAVPDLAAGEPGIPWRRRLLTRTVFFLLVPCILPLFLVCGAVLYYMGVDAQRQMEHVMTAAVQDAARKVEYYFNEVEGDIRFVSTHFDHDAPDSPGNTLLIAAFAATHTEILTVWLCGRDQQTRVLYSRQEMLSQEKPPPIVLRPPEQNDTAATWHATAYDAFGDPVLTGSVAVLHPWDAQSFGTLIFTIQPRLLEDLAGHMDTGKNGSAFLVAGDGKAVSYSGRPVALARLDLSNHPAMPLLREQAPGGGAGFAQDQASLIAYSAVTPMRWGIVLQRSKAEVYQARNRMAWLVVAAFVALTVLAVPLVISFSLRIIRPISTLLQSIQKFAAGDLSIQKYTANGSELGFLSEAFYQMAEQRISSERSYREIVDGTDNLITQVDAAGRFIFVNHVGERIFGESLAQVLGEPAFDFIHPDDRERTRQWFADCVAQGLSQATIENRQVARRDGGQVFHFLWNCHFRYGKNGEFLGVNGVAHDISARKLLEEERRQVEERSRQSQKMESIGTLAGGIAHDFNNILTPILGYADLCLATLPASDSVADNIRAILNAAMRAKDLVQQILTFSRRAVLERAPLQPHPIVKETVKLLRSSLPSTIEIRENIPSDCGMILGDPTQLQQIIMNLGTNAYHAMREQGGVLSVTLASKDISEEDRKVVGLEMAAGPYVEIVVSDTGCGMDRATLARIFEPYFTTKKKGEGTGLGLAIIHGIVKSSGGHITVYSEPGQGTAFHVYLPRLAEGGEPEAAAAVAGPPPGGSERVLVVDDEGAITDLLRNILTALGYQVTVCNESTEALRLFQERPDGFDLLITDMTMPHLTGTELSRKIFKIRPDMPIVLSTGFSELINREKAMRLGIREFLMKPITLRGLAHAVRNALDGR